MNYNEAITIAQNLLNGNATSNQVKPEPNFEQPRLSPETAMQIELAKRYQQQIQEQHLLHQVAIAQLDGRFAQMVQSLPPDLQAQVVNMEQQSMQVRRSNFSSWFGA